jgi:hypothetical protein
MPLSTSTRVEYFAGAAFAAGLVPAALGVNAILRPASALSLLSFPEPRDPEGRRLALSLMRIYGARNMAVGLSTLAAWAGGDRRALALTMLAQLPMAVVDGFVSRAQIGAREWDHWGFTVVGVVLAAGLLGYL